MNKNCKPNIIVPDYFSVVVVQTINERNDISCKLRQNGMIAVVVEEGYTQYQIRNFEGLHAVCDNRSWIKITEGVASSSGGITGDYIPLSGTEEGKPITGSIEILEDADYDIEFRKSTPTYNSYSWFRFRDVGGFNFGENKDGKTVSIDTHIDKGLIGDQELNKQGDRKAFAQLSDVYDSNFKEITKSELDTLISTDKLVKGTLYKITEVESWMKLGDSTKAIYLHAISEKQLATRGEGEFFVPKYNKDIDCYGIWQGEVFEAFPDSVTEPTYAANDTVIWGGRLWKNVNGNLGAKIDHYTLDEEWEVVQFNTTDYAIRINVIDYDYANDMITYRKDDNGTEISTSFEHWKYLENDWFDGNALEDSNYNPLKIYQWGNELSTENYKGTGFNIVSNSILECINSCGNIYFNTLNNNGNIQSNTLNNGGIYFNTLNNNGSIQSNTLNNGNIYFNTLNNGNIQSNTLNNGGVKSNTLNNGSIYFNTLNNNGNISNLTIENGDIGGDTGIDLSSATIIFDNNYPKTIFKNSAGLTRMSYYNSSDVLVVTDLTS